MPPEVADNTEGTPRGLYVVTAPGAQARYLVVEAGPGDVAATVVAECPTHAGACAVRAALVRDRSR